MPRTASTRQSRASQARPTARTPIQNVTETTPVLFRLPTIDLQRLPAAADFAAEENTAPVQLQLQVAAVVTPSVAAVEPPPVQSNAENRSAPPQSALLNERTEAKRSWWEHWSSGIVLILLIIALVTASILVFSDSNPEADYLAAGEKEDDFGMLADIDVPDIHFGSEIAEPVTEPTGTQGNIGELASTNPTPSADQGLSLESEASVGSVATEQSTGQESLILGGLEFSDASTETDLEQSDEAHKVARAQLAEPTDPNAGHSQATASLALPTNLPLPGHTESTSLVGDSTSVQSVSIPAFPVSTTSPTLQTPPSTAGQSPSLYDGADSTVMTNTGQVLVQQSLDAASPKQSNSSMPVMGATSSPTQVTASTVSTPLGSATGQVGGTAESQQVQDATSALLKTATPDSDADALIRVYQSWDALSKQGTSANLYTSPAGPTAPPTYTLGQ